jgi:small subunit ribosomal protein S20
MANIKSAKKRIKVTEKKTARNRRVKDHVKAGIKEFEQALEDGDLELAEEKRRLAEKKLRQGADKGSINKKAASRKISRITKKLNAAKAEE